MSRRFFQMLLISLLVFLPGGPALRAADIGTAFTYQGHLTDSGSPANEIYDFEFKLYDAETGGTQQGSTVTLDDVRVENGLFKVDVDFGAAVFAGEARYVEIGVRPGTSTDGYTPIRARQELTPTPYAIHALSAASAATLSGVRAQVSAKDGISTTNTNWEDMKDMSIEVNTGIHPVLIMFTASGVALRSGDYIQIRLLVDEEEKCMVVNGLGNSDEHNMNLNCLETLSKGDHTIKVQWKISGPGPAVASEEGSTRNLIVVEL